MDWEGLLDGMTGAIRDTFGKPFSYFRVSTQGTHTTTPSGAPLTGVLDFEMAESREGGSLGVTNRQTVLDVRLSDLGFVPETKDEVTIDGIKYSVLAKVPSSSGMMKLHLRKG